jgi:hypothetical protein
MGWFGCGVTVGRWRESMIRGDQVLIKSKTDGEIDGKLGVVLDDVDENLLSGRMCYTKVMVMISGIPKVRYLCPDSLELVL